MNFVNVIDKIEILLYSSLISIMGGISHVLNTGQYLNPRNNKTSVANVDSSGSLEQSPGRQRVINLESIQQDFLYLLLWIVLGFAAGFLVGMIKSG